MPLGALLFSGELSRAFYAFESAGRGPAGWQAVRDALRFRHPDIRANTVEGFVRFMRATIGIGNQYRQGGPNYIPSRTPDARPAESRDPQVPRPPPPTSNWHFNQHEYIIEIYDPQHGGQIVQRFTDVIRRKNVLSRLEFENIALDRAEAFHSRFLAYDDRLKDEYQLEYRIKLMGVFSTW